VPPRPLALHRFEARLHQHDQLANPPAPGRRTTGQTHSENMPRTERPIMPARNIKSCIAVAAAAAAVGFGAIAPAAASIGFAAAPASALAAGSGGGAGKASMQDFHLTQLILPVRDDPHTSFDDGAHPVVLCATAIEYGLIAAL
jgi:hypothetical protein